MKPDRYFREEEEISLREFRQAAKDNDVEGQWQFYDAEGNEYWVYGS